MRTIIAGGRDCTDPYILLAAIDNCGWEPRCILTGMARGADTLGLKYAEECNIPVIRFYPEWNFPSGKYDPAAGFKRNLEMAKCGEALIALWDGYSKGTANMIDLANKMKLKVYVHLYEN